MSKENITARLWVADYNLVGSYKMVTSVVDVLSYRATFDDAMDELRDQAVERSNLYADPEDVDTWSELINEIDTARKAGPCGSHFVTSISPERSRFYVERIELDFDGIVRACENGVLDIADALMLSRKPPRTVHE